MNFDYLAQLAADPTAWAALVTLIIMEVVLGIDNLVFISILTNKLPEERRAFARSLGLGLALVMRLALLGAVAFIVHLTDPIVTLFGKGLSWRDLILIGGGLFLVWKATREIHESVDPNVEHGEHETIIANFSATVAQIIGLDLVFSIDSIITAVGMTDHLPIMIVAVIVAVLAWRRQPGRSRPLSAKTPPWSCWR